MYVFQIYIKMVYREENTLLAKSFHFGLIV